MSRCVIIGGGPYQDPRLLAQKILADDVVIAADSGWGLAAEMQTKPAVLVADFDSLGEMAIPDDVKVVSLPIKKDDTDTAVAIRVGYDMGIREFLLLGCTGGRLDHYYATLTVAAQYAAKGCRMMIADEQNDIRVLTAGVHRIQTTPNTIVSLFAFGGNVEDLSVDNVEYDIKRFVLSPLNPLCVSNSALGNEINVCFKSGILLLHFSHD